MPAPKTQLRTNKLLWIVLIAVAARIVLALVYDARSWPETSRYLQLARHFTSGDYTGYLGKNVPVYSFLLILTGFNFKLMFLIQTAMGVAVSALVYLIFRRLSGSEWIGFFAALAYAINPAELLFEAAFMPEAVCTFWLAVIVWLLLEIWSGGIRESWWSYALLGLICVTCLLTRPHYQFVPPLVLLFLIWRLRKSWRRLAVYAVSFTVPVAIFLGAWLNFQHRHAGKASITTHLGITLMYHTLDFIEYAPQRFEPVKGVLLKERAEYLRQSGLTYGAVEAAIPELMEKCHLTYTGVDSVYMQMALATIGRKPGLYLASVVRAMLRFFKPSWYSSNFGIRVVLAHGAWPARITAACYSLLFLCLVGLFLLGQGAVLFSRKFRESLTTGKFFDIIVLFLYALIWLAAGTQSVLVLGENSRMRVSVEPMILGLAVWSAALLFEYWTSRNHGGEREPSAYNTTGVP